MDVATKKIGAGRESPLETNAQESKKFSDLSKNQQERIRDDFKKIPSKLAKEFPPEE